MSRHPQEIMQIFLNCLDLDQVSADEFSGHSPDFGWQRIFGGQTISQSLVAAQRTVPNDRFVHSLHAYFVSWGDPNQAVNFTVERVRDGASFSLRSVRVSQSGRTIMTFQASFQKLEAGLTHQEPMPSVPMPEDLPDICALEKLEGGSAKDLKEYFKRDRPMEFRPVSLDRFTKNEPLAPNHMVWFRLIDEVTACEDEHLSAVMLSYISDALLIDTALFPHATNIFDGRLIGGSLDHSVWFHRPFKLNDWVLYHMESPAAACARGFARGNLFLKDGTLIASVAQQGLIRKRANAK